MKEEIMKNKIILNKNYYIIQTKNNSNCFNCLKDANNDKTLTESFNIYSFISKAKNICRITKNNELNMINFSERN